MRDEKRKRVKKRRTTDYCNVEVEEAEEGRRKDKQGSFRLSKVDGGENVRSVAGMCLAGCRLPVTSLAANTAQRYVCSIGNFLSFPSSAGKIKTRSSRRVIVDRWPKDYQRIKETCLSASLSSIYAAPPLWRGCFTVEQFVATFFRIPSPSSSFHRNYTRHPTRERAGCTHPLPPFLNRCWQTVVLRLTRRP